MKVFTRNNYQDEQESLNWVKRQIQTKGKWSVVQNGMVSALEIQLESKNIVGRIR